jgi:hypothetical protein
VSAPLTTSAGASAAITRANPGGRVTRRPRPFRTGGVAKRVICGISSLPPCGYGATWLRSQWEDACGRWHERGAVSDAGSSGATAGTAARSRRSAAIGAATTPPQMAPRGSSIETRITETWFARAHAGERRDIVRRRVPRSPGRVCQFRLAGHRVAGDGCRGTSAGAAPLSMARTLRATTGSTVCSGRASRPRTAVDEVRRQPGATVGAAANAAAICNRRDRDPWPIGTLPMVEPDHSFRGRTMPGDSPKSMPAGLLNPKRSISAPDAQAGHGRA